MAKKTIIIISQNKGRGSGVVISQQAKFLKNKGHKVILMYPGNQMFGNGTIDINIPLHTNVIPVHENLPNEKSQKPNPTRKKK